MINNNIFLWRRKIALIIVTVITANVYTTYAQSYLLAIGQNPHIYFERQVIPHPNGNYSTDGGAFNVQQQEEEQQQQNSTIIVIKKEVNSNSSDLSKTAMDVITIVWYVATFLALAAFFLLMACSDRRCNPSRRQQEANNNNNNNNMENVIAPPTPTPSYSEFAPPSYESVMKLNNVPSIYVIPFPMEEEKETNDNGTTNSHVTFFTVNELEKLGS